MDGIFGDRADRVDGVVFRSVQASLRDAKRLWCLYPQAVNCWAIVKTSLQDENHRQLVCNNEAFTSGTMSIDSVFLDSQA